MLLANAAPLLSCLDPLREVELGGGLQQRILGILGMVVWEGEDCHRGEMSTYVTVASTGCFNVVLSFNAELMEVCYFKCFETLMLGMKELFLQICSHFW